MTNKERRIIDKAMIAEMSIQDIIRCLVYNSLVCNMESLDRVMQSASNAFQELQEEVIYGESVDDYAD